MSSFRTIRSTTALRSIFTARPVMQSRGLATTRSLRDPPRSQAPPAHPSTTKDSSIKYIAAAGVGLGAVFFFFLSRPDKAIELSTSHSNSSSQDISTNNKSPPAAGNRGKDT